VIDLAPPGSVLSKTAAVLTTLSAKEPVDFYFSRQMLSDAFGPDATYDDLHAASGGQLTRSPAERTTSPHTRIVAEAGQGLGRPTLGRSHD
jgi:hypothetical protein